MMEKKPESEQYDLKAMGKGWLKRTGYPTLHVSNAVFDEAKQTYSVEFKQTGYEAHSDPDERYPWTIPVDWALVTNGENVNQGVYVLQDGVGVLTVSNVTSAPDFISVARDWSFFGEVADEANNPSQKVKQALSDPDVINRYLAYRNIAEAEKALIIEHLLLKGEGSAEGSKNKASGDVKVSEGYLELFGSILSDNKISGSTKALFLNVTESIPSRPDLAHRYKVITGLSERVIRIIDTL